MTQINNKIRFNLKYSKIKKESKFRNYILLNLPLGSPSFPSSLSIPSIPVPGSRNSSPSPPSPPPAFLSVSSAFCLTSPALLSPVLAIFPKYSAATSLPPTPTAIPIAIAKPAASPQANGTKNV